MRRRFREHLTYANVVSTLTLFIVLGTGTAYATHLVVNSSDVVNESLLSEDLKDGSAVRSSDVANGQITGADLADGTVASADVRNESLTGGDVAPDSLTGADIREGTLGQVRTATLGGLGRSAAEDRCDPEGTSYVRCVQITLTLPDPARVHLNGRLSVQRENPTQGAFAICRWGGVVESGDLFGEAGVTGHDLSLVGLSGPLPAGTWTFGIECGESSGEGVIVRDAWMTAVAISPS